MLFLRKLSKKTSFKKENNLMVQRFLFYMSIIFLSSWTQAHSQKVVNVYCWANVLTPEILHQFERETGIRVNYDVYDSPEVMETKLLAGNSGYDVVVVTFWPYFARQAEAQIYLPLNRALLSQWKNLDSTLLKRMENADPGNQFAVPLTWGTTGFAFHRQMILQRFPEAPIRSSAMLFSPEVVARFKDCGVMFIDSPIDVFPSVLSYLKKDPNSQSLEDLKMASSVLQSLRPFVKKFRSMPTVDDLISEDYCLVEGYSTDLLKAQKIGKENGLDIEYVIPQDGAALWVDAFAIPKDAPHITEAHAFINFILRPDIIAQITNTTETANSVPSSLAFVEKNIKENPLVFPSQEIVSKLYIDKAHSPRYERLRLREWTRVKTGR